MASYVIQSGMLVLGKRHHSQSTGKRYRRCRTVANADLKELSSSKLLQLCLTSNADDAWYEFARRYQPVISSVVVKTLRRCINPSPSLVDDLVQETYLKLCDHNFKALRRFECRHENALAGFLKVVASNVTQDYLRSRLSIKNGNGKADDQLDEATPQKHFVVSSNKLAERRIMLSQIASCLERESSEANFKRDCRIFWLYYWCGLTADEISRRPEIELSVKGVESALFRLTKLLRTKLGGTVSKTRRSKAAAA